jgi:hypothetical protein
VGSRRRGKVEITAMLRLSVEVEVRGVGASATDKNYLAELASQEVGYDLGMFDCLIGRGGGSDGFEDECDWPSENGLDWGYRVGGVEVADITPAAYRQKRSTRVGYKGSEKARNAAAKAWLTRNRKAQEAIERAARDADSPPASAERQVGGNDE